MGSHEKPTCSIMAVNKMSSKNAVCNGNLENEKAISNLKRELSHALDCAREKASQLLKLESELSQYKDRAKELNTENEELLSDVHILVSANQTMRRKNETLQREVNEWRQLANERDDENGELLNDTREHVLLSENQALTKENDDLKRELSELRQSKKKLDAENETVIFSASQTFCEKNDALQNELKALRHSAQQLNDENEELLNDMYDVLNENEELQVTNGQLRFKVKLLVQKVEEQEREHEETLLDPDEVAYLVDDIREQVKHKVRKYTLKNKALQSDIEKLVLEKIKLISKRNSMEHHIKVIESENSNATRKMEEATKVIKGLQRSMDEYEREVVNLKECLRKEKSGHRKEHVEFAEREFQIGN
mmetsp:Transcript_49749/g.73971  ORF Transcript_49749/g.73971 Transcript_49749/m.73971 type:complete len:366 (+) Transcript_49749:2-1099(+)